MKILHLSDAATMLKHAQNFKSCHYLNLLNGKVISIGEIADVHEAGFIADGAIALPHMLSSDPIGSAFPKSHRKAQSLRPHSAKPCWD